ncbi:hypothetical protein Tco_0256014 [Tanacetum coccineum]
MTKLTQSGVKFDLGDKAEAAFQLIKLKLCSRFWLYLKEVKILSYTAMLRSKIGGFAFKKSSGDTIYMEPSESDFTS